MLVKLLLFSWYRHALADSVQNRRFLVFHFLMRFLLCILPLLLHLQQPRKRQLHSDHDLLIYLVRIRYSFEEELVEGGDLLTVLLVARVHPAGASGVVGQRTNVGVALCITHVNGLGNVRVVFQELPG